MFDYIHVEELKEADLKIHLKRVNYQARLVIDAPLFYELGNELLNGLMAGRFFEIVVLIPKGFKPLELGSLMHRLVQGGANIGFLEVGFLVSDMEMFAVLDNKILFSDRLHQIEKDIMALVVQKHKDFELVMAKSQTVKTSSNGVEIKFRADNYFVSKNDPVQLSWEVKNADMIVLNPGAKVLDAKGNMSLVIEEDTLFTIKCKNSKYTSTLSIFIKYLDDDSLTLLLLVYNRELDSFVQLEPLGDEYSRYAVYKGDLVKIEWICKGEYQLSELNMGPLENIGSHEIILIRHNVFEFSIKQNQEVATRKLEIFPISDEGPLVDQVPFIGTKEVPDGIITRNDGHEKLKKSWMERLGLYFKK
jgi:hypothetical protein